MKNYKLFVLLGVFGLLLTSCVKEENDYGNPQKDMENPYAVSVDQALTELDGVLQVIDVQTRGDKIRSIRCVETVAVHDVKAPTRGVQDETVGNLVHIVNFTDDEGYAILGADSRVPSVVAVVEKGNLTAAEYIDMANNGVPCDEFGNPVVYPPVVQLGLTPVDSLGSIWGGGIPDYDWTFDKEYGPWQEVAKCNTLVTTKWGQKSPYNDRCPIINNQRAPAGCVAVALGQIIATNGHRFDFYPNQIAGQTIMWNPILQTIQNNDIDGNQASSQIAHLLRAIGIAVDMKYGSSSSTAFSENAEQLLRDIGYRNVALIDYDMNVVTNLLCREHLPVYISGETSSLDRAHAWVLDGQLSQERLIKFYNSRREEVFRKTEIRNLVHCNFGWSAVADGYYVEGLFNTAWGRELLDRNDSGGTGQYNYSTHNKIISYNR